MVALTSLVKDELSRVSVLKPCCRKAEVCALRSSPVSIPSRPIFLAVAGPTP